MRFVYKLKVGAAWKAWRVDKWEGKTVNRTFEKALKSVRKSLQDQDMEWEERFEGEYMILEAA